MSIRRRPWTCTDVAKLRELYPDHQNDEIAAALDRTKHGISLLARRLGLRKAFHWSDEDDEKLALLYGRVSGARLMDLLGTRRSENALRTRASKLGLTGPKRAGRKE